MSIPVDLTALHAQIERFGPVAVLVSTAPSGPPHVSSVAVALVDGALVMGCGRRTRANIATRPEVALMWLNGAEPDYGLIVDGTVETVDGETLTVRPTAAVLHRLAGAETQLPRCLPVDAADADADAEN